MWWWNGEESFIEILIVLQIEDQNLKVNCVPLWERILFDSPWSLKMEVINVILVFSEEGTLEKGMKWSILVNLLNITKIQI